jgi:hypothetical protein
MTHHSSTCGHVLKVLAGRVGNFKCMNVELQTSSDDDVRITSMRPQKLATQSAPTMQLSCKNQFGFRVFVYKGFSMGSYQRCTTLPSRL